MAVVTETVGSALRPGHLIDGCGRKVDHLRLSVTSACDLRCAYCRPDVRSDQQPLGRMLTDDQRVEFVRFLHERHGLSQVRITGGEPLLHRRIVPLVAELRRALPDVELAMTTNGRRLYHKGFELFHAGLDRVNISLDSLRPERYRRITGGEIEDVLTGIDSAAFVGFRKVRINTVVLRAVNDDEIAELAAWAFSRGHEIRFLEAMPIGPAAESNRRSFVSASTIQARLAERFRLEPMPRRPGETARRFRATTAGHSGVVGLIAPVTDSFCDGCRRMRLTADGFLYPCLLDGLRVDIRPAWAGGRLDGPRAGAIIRSALADKRPQGSRQDAHMVAIGG